MSTLIVEVCRIERVLPHPNADALELAHIKGWQVVVPKGRYSAGSAVVYVPVDSVLPLELSERLGVTKYLSQGRVRCAKLRGEPSFGLVFEPDEPNLPEGTSVRERYGISRYQPPVRPSSEDAEAEHPLFARYTSVENLRNFPAVLSAGEEVVVTEKIHGTNCRVGLVEGTWMAGSMEVRRKQPQAGTQGTSLYWFPTYLPGVRELLTELGAAHRQVILFGEVFGSKVQSLHYGRVGGLGFCAFDLLLDGHYLDWDDFAARCQQHGVATVPLLHKGPYQAEAVRALSCGKTTLHGDHIREGVVVKPARERTDPRLGRVILKYVGDDYLFAKGITDSRDV